MLQSTSAPKVPSSARRRSKKEKLKEKKKTLKKSKEIAGGKKRRKRSVTKHRLSLGSRTGMKKKKKSSEGEYERGVLYVRVVGAEEGTVFGEEGRKFGIFLLATSTFGRQMFKTKTVKKGAEANWQEQFEFISDDMDGILSLSLFSAKKQTCVKLGEATVDLISLEENTENFLWVDVTFLDPVLSSKIESDPSLSYKINLVIYHAESELKEIEEVKVFEDHYEIGELVGEGGFSTVFLANSKETEDLYAVKQVDIKDDPQLLNALEREIEIMKILRHENIIDLIDTFREKDTLYIVLEYAPDGELFDFLMDNGNLSEYDSYFIVNQILEAVAYMHSNGICHRDLKLENILMCDKELLSIKITDFGFSKDFSNDSLQTSCGTPDYAAPEILSGMPYDNSVDIWSTGVITYMLLSGIAPFFGDTNQEIFRKILAANFSFPHDFWKDVSRDAKDFISAILVLNFNNRPSARQCLQSPWFKKMRKLSQEAEASP